MISDMVSHRVARSLGLLWVATGARGCGSPEGVLGPPAEVAAITENGLIANGLTANGLIANGLIANGLIANGLVANGLTANGLVANGLVANGINAAALSDPLTQKFLKYVVSCALDRQPSLSF